MAVTALLEGRVNEMSVLSSPRWLTFWTIMSMFTSRPATVVKIAAAAPTRSGTPITVILASLRSWATPEISACSMGFSFSSMCLTHVPGLSENDERTCTGTISRRAYSTQRRCRILAPEAAISSISS